MLRHTYLHVPGVGEKRERDLWLRGFTDWDAFRGGHPSGSWRELILSHLDDGRAARELPRREAWRLAKEFPGRTLYLDIETTGLSFEGDSVTCVGVSDGTSTQAFVRGRDLDRFPQALDGIELLVTYNGSSFDLPVLRNAFPRIDFDRFHHIDLRFPLHRLGVKGGLKGAERQLGIGRSETLDTLLRYCLEDVVSLKPLLALVYNRLTAALPLSIAPIEDDRRPPIAHAADVALVRDLLQKRAWA